MKKKLAGILTIFLLLSLVFFASAVQAETIEDPDEVFSCSAIIAGRLATADGSVFFSHNEDGGTPTPSIMHVMPRQTYAPGSTFTLLNGAVIPQVEQTWACLWTETLGQTVSDAYLNEWGVAISSNNCSNSRETAPYDYTDGGVGHYLRRLVAERAKTAREGVLIAGQLVEQYGYNAASGRCYLIADPMEGWLFQVVRGRHWVAQRVPDDEVAFIPNYYTIRQVDLSDTDNFLACPDLIEYAIAKGWYDPESGPFDFAKVYNTESTQRSSGNVLRHYNALRLLTGVEYPDMYDLPFSVKSNRLLTLQDIAEVMRCHYEGTQWAWDPSYSTHPHSFRIDGSSIRTICTSTTLESFIMQLRSFMPAEIGNVYWKAPSRPCSSAYVPWYSGILEAAEPYTVGERNTPNSNDPSSAYYAHKKLSDLVNENYAERHPIVRAAWDELEKEFFSSQKGIETAAMAQLKNKNKDMMPKVREFLTKQTYDRAMKAYNKALELVEIWEPGWSDL